MFHLALYLGCVFVGAVSLGPLGAILGLFVACFMTLFTNWRVGVLLMLLWGTFGYWLYNLIIHLK